VSVSIRYQESEDYFIILIIISAEISNLLEFIKLLLKLNLIYFIKGTINGTENTCLTCKVQSSNIEKGVVTMNSVSLTTPIRLNYEEIVRVNFTNTFPCIPKVLIAIISIDKYDIPQ